MGSSTIITVDHLDPRLRFSGGWFSSRSPGESVVTARATQSAGSFLTFTFSGKSSLHKLVSWLLIDYR